MYLTANPAQRLAIAHQIVATSSAFIPHGWRQDRVFGRSDAANAKSG
jgi:hypothetical protein